MTQRCPGVMKLRNNTLTVRASFQKDYTYCKWKQERISQRVTEVPGGKRASKGQITQSHTGSRTKDGFGPSVSAWKAWSAWYWFKNRGSSMATDPEAANCYPLVKQNEFVLGHSETECSSFVPQGWKSFRKHLQEA